MDFVQLNDVSLYEHFKYVGPDDLVVMVHKSGCKPCETMKTRYEKVAKRSWGSVHFAQMHQSEAPDTIASLEIKLFPSFVLFRNRKAVSVKQGSMNIKDFERWLLYT